MAKEIILAPIDQKNVMSDWIAEIFDDGDCTSDGGNKLVGFIKGYPVYAKWFSNQIWWNFVQGQDTGACKELIRRLDEHEDPKSGLFSRRDIFGDGIFSDEFHLLIQHFYFRLD